MPTQAIGDHSNLGQLAIEAGPNMEAHFVPDVAILQVLCPGSRRAHL